MSIVKRYTVREIKKGGDQIFKQLYVETRPVFMNYLKRFNLTDDDRKDIFQESFMIFYKNIITGKLIELTSSVSTYIISIGKFKALERYRELGKFVNDSETIAYQREAEVSVIDFEIGAKEMNSEQKLLYKYFNQLGESCRDIITNFYFHGLTISEIMDIGNYNSENVVKSQKSRCMKQLRELVNTHRNG